MVARPTRVAPSSAATVRCIRSVAERMLANFGPIAGRVQEAILESTPVLAADPVLAAETRASTTANVGRWITATIARPEAEVPPEAPLEALDLARDVARRGLDHDDLLTAYRRGQNALWQEWMACAQDQHLDRDEFVAVLDHGSRSLFAYVDGVLAELTREMDTERASIVDGALARRRETATLILDDAPVDQSRASAQLGYALDGHHVASVLWAADGTIGTGELERASGILSRALDARRALTITAGFSALWAWAPSRTVDADRLRAVAEAMPAGVLATVGSSRPGIDGFRDSHREAIDTQRLVMGRRSPPRITSYDEVRAVSLASWDLARAGDFVTTTLGRLATDEPELRETVREYLRAGSSASRAAKVLHMHRNTVLRRIERAAEELPRPLADQELEVRLALELARWIGPPSESGARARRPPG